MAVTTPKPTEKAPRKPYDFSAASEKLARSWGSILRAGKRQDITEQQKKVVGEVEPLLKAAFAKLAQL